MNGLTEVEDRTAGTAASGAAWMGVVSIAAGVFLLVTTEFLPIGLLTSIAASLGVSEGTAGLSVTAPGFVAAIAAPIFTVLAGRIDRRIVVVALTAAIVVSNVIAVIAPNFAIFLIGRLVLGLAVGGLWSFAVAVGRRLVPESAGARATSIISTGISAGTVFGMPVGAVAGHLVGWRTVFAINALLGLLVILVQWRLLPRLASTAAIGVRQLTAFAKGPMARVGLIASGLVAAGHFIAYTFLEPYLRGPLAFGQTGVAMVLAGYAAAGIIGSFLGEHLGVRNIRRAFVAISFLLAISVLAAISTAGVPSAAVVTVMVWGLAFGAVPVCVQLWMFTSSPKLFEAGSALMVSAFQIALAAGAAIGGLLVDTVGIGAAFIVSGVVIGAGGAVAALLRITPRPAA